MNKDIEKDSLSRKEVTVWENTSSGEQKCPVPSRTFPAYEE